MAGALHVSLAFWVCSLLSVGVRATLPRQPTWDSAGTHEQDFGEDSRRQDEKLSPGNGLCRQWSSWLSPFSTSQSLSLFLFVLSLLQ